MSSSWHASVLTLYPEMFPGTLGHSIIGKAREKGLWSMDAVNIRDFAQDKHQTVDDAAFGGGAGMVMRPDVLDRALHSICPMGPETGPVVYFSPRGKKMTHARIKELAAEKKIAMICGRFEGIDQRVLDTWAVEELSLGDFVLCGGEVAALALIEACVRLLPGVVGKAESLEDESFATGLLEYPHYTRPARWNGVDVPEVLLSGHHEKITMWRKTAAEEITQQRRPDLWTQYVALRENRG